MKVGTFTHIPISYSYCLTVVENVCTGKHEGVKSYVLAGDNKRKVFAQEFEWHDTLRQQTNAVGRTAAYCGGFGFRCLTSRMTASGGYVALVTELTCGGRSYL